MIRITRATKLLTLIVLLFSMSAIAADIEAPYGEELWKSSFGEKILWQQLTDCGYLIVSTADTLYCLDPADGTIQWKMDEFGKLPRDYFDTISGTQYVAITCAQSERRKKSKLIFYDIPSGEELWNSDKFNITDANGQVFIPEISSLFIVGTDADKRSISALVNILTGEPFWTSQELFNSSGSKAPAKFPIGQYAESSRKSINGNQIPVVTPDSNFVEFFSGQGLRKIDSKTGKVLWTWPIKVKEVPSLRKGWAPMTLNEDGSIVYVPFEETLHAVNTADGSLAWDKKGLNLKGQVQQIKLTPDGVVVRGFGRTAEDKDYDEPWVKPFINVLSYETGKSIWRKPFRKLSNSSSMTVDGERILLYIHGASFHGELVSIKIADGEVTEIVEKIRFNGEEFPQTIEVKEDGYVLTSPCNIAKYDKDGNELWHVYFKAPSRGLFGKIATTAVVIALNNLSDANAESRERIRAWRQNRPFSPDSVEYINLSPVFAWRLTTSKDSLNYRYIVTNVEGGNSTSTENAGVVKVNKETGKVESRISLGKKEPNFEIDVFENRIFFLSGASEITCYKL